jgi:hypothetical protein
MSTTKAKTKIIRGEELKTFCESYTKPIGLDGKILKVREFNKEQLSDFRRVCNYNYRLNPEKQALANESALRCHHKRKEIEDDYQRKRYLGKVGMLTRPRKQFLDMSALD